MVGSLPLKIIAWNVNGLRSIYAKNLGEFLSLQQPSVLCLQETKLTEADLEQIPVPPPGYSALFSWANRKGYSGVATYVNANEAPCIGMPGRGIGCSEFDDEGRFLFTDHGRILLVNVYFPSGTSGDHRQQFKYKFLDCFLDHLEKLPAVDKKRLVICGDFNICHHEIDIHHPEVATKRKLTGFLPEERAWMDRFVAAGFVDTFRHCNGDCEGKYTWWTFRAGARPKNLGWRIDYIFVARELSKNIRSANIHADVFGSDHCPISVTLEF